jgi:hypothetical protein
VILILLFNLSTSVDFWRYTNHHLRLVVAPYITPMRCRQLTQRDWPYALNCKLTIC